MKWEGFPLAFPKFIYEPVRTLHHQKHIGQLIFNQKVMKVSGDLVPVDPSSLLMLITEHASELIQLC